MYFYLVLGKGPTGIVTHDPCWDMRYVKSAWRLVGCLWQPKSLTTHCVHDISTSTNVKKIYNISPNSSQSNGFFGMPPYSSTRTIEPITLWCCYIQVVHVCSIAVLQPAFDFHIYQTIFEYQALCILICHDNSIQTWGSAETYSRNVLTDKSLVWRVNHTVNAA